MQVLNALKNTYCGCFTLQTNKKKIKGQYQAATITGLKSKEKNIQNHGFQY